MADISRGPLRKAEAEALARDFDLVVAQPFLLRNGQLLSAMRAANPGILVFAYVNGMFSGRTPYLEDAYAHSSGGVLAGKSTAVASPRTRIRDDASPEPLNNYGQYLMEPSSAGWRNSILQTCRQAKAQGFSGCYLDSMGTASLSTAYVRAVPTDPRSGRVYTAAEWIAATSAYAPMIRSALGGDWPVAVNGLRDGAEYFAAGAPTAAYAARSWGAHAELWLRNKTAPIGAFRTETAWRQDVDMLVDAERRGYRILTTTKTWARPTPGADEVDRWHRYALASFLLGAGPHCYFAFSGRPHDYADIVSNRYDKTEIGAAQGPYALRRGVYLRTFSGGLAAVNPTPAPLELTLPGRSYLDLDGVRHSGTVPLPAHSGTVLRG